LTCVFRSSFSSTGYRSVIAFPDLSVRCDNDEWDVLQYPHLELMERSRQALVRAGQMVMCANNKIAACWLVVDDASKRLPLHDADDSDDSANIMKYMTMEEIISEFAKARSLSSDQMEQLLQLKASCEEEYQRRNSPPEEIETTTANSVFSEEEIRKRLTDGRLLRGRFNVTKENVHEAFVTASSAKSRTFFIQQEYFHRAFHQDIVLIEPLPESQWGRPIGKRRLVHTTHDDDYDDDEDDKNNSLDQPDQTPTVPSARVVAIDSPTRRVFVATLTSAPSSSDGAVLVVPMDVRIPKIRIRTRSAQRFINVRLKVEIIDWEADSHYPTGHCVQVLGPIGDLETEIQALLIENQVELDPFSAQAMACLPDEGSDWRVTEHEIEQRRDLRMSRRVFSVDPPGCQDIDDTMHAEVLPNGDIEGENWRKQLRVFTFVVVVAFPNRLPLSSISSWCTYCGCYPLCLSQLAA